METHTAKYVCVYCHTCLSYTNHIGIEYFYSKNFVFSCNKCYKKNYTLSSKEILLANSIVEIEKYLKSEFSSPEIFYLWYGDYIPYVIGKVESAKELIKRERVRLYKKVNEEYIEVI